MPRLYYVLLGLATAGLASGFDLMETIINFN